MSMRPLGGEEVFACGPLRVMKATTHTQRAKPPTTSAFVKCCRVGDVEAVRALLEEGHSPNERDRNGSTPLMHAVWHASPSNGHNIDIAEVLLDSGADVNAQNVRLNTALHFAYERENMVLASFLLQRGARASEVKRNAMRMRPRELLPSHDPVKKYIRAALKDVPRLPLDDMDRPPSSSSRQRRYINRSVMAPDGFSLADVFDAADVDGDRKISVDEELPVALKAIGLTWSEQLQTQFREGGLRGVRLLVNPAAVPADTSRTAREPSPEDGDVSHVDFTTFCRLVKALQPLKASSRSGRLSPLVTPVSARPVDLWGPARHTASESKLVTHRRTKSSLFTRRKGGPSPRLDGGEGVEAVPHRVHLTGPMPRNAVFLGGACNPTTWRKDIAMPLLSAAGVSFFNPQVEEWSPDCIAVEAAAKAEALLVLFVVASETRAVASMVEVSELIASGRNVVLVLQDVKPGCAVNGVDLSDDEIRDLNRGRAYLADVASRKGFPVYQSITAGVEEALRRFGQGGPPSPSMYSP